MKQVKPGNDFMEPNRAAMRVLAGGLEELGKLEETMVGAAAEKAALVRDDLAALLRRGLRRGARGDREARASGPARLRAARRAARV